MRLREPQDLALSPRAAETIEIVRRHFGDLPDGRREALASALRSGAKKAGGPRRALVGSFSAAAIAAACAVLVGSVVAHRHARSQPLSFRVEGAEVHVGGYVEAGAASRPVVRFSDGSEVTLSERSRAHVRALDDRGARVTLDDGRVHVYVVHTPSTSWSFDAGPYVVAVTGTAFGISWDAVDRRLDVQLENGTVMVSGPVFDTPVALRAGQSLTVRGHDVLIRDFMSTEPAPTRQTDAVAAVAEPSPAAPAEPPAAPAKRAARSSDAVARSATEGRDRAPFERERMQTPRASPIAEHRWAGQVAEGKFERVVGEASEIGLATAVSTSSSDDLAALADAARYTRRYDVARSAFLAQRERFASSERARTAAFSLGRLAETQRDFRLALSWFERYLTEAPEGTFASEALGRKMLLVQELDGRATARPLAEAYLQRFPDGTYAQAARALTLGP